MEDPSDDHERVLRDYVAWANGDDAKREVLADSVDVYNPGLPGGEVHRRDAYGAYLETVRSGFPDLQFAVDEHVADDGLLMAEFTITGTHEGEFGWIPPTGRAVEIRGAETMEIRDGTVREIRVFYDTQQIPEQLGLTFPTVLVQLPKLAWRKVR